MQMLCEGLWKNVDVDVVDEILICIGNGGFVGGVGMVGLAVVRIFAPWAGLYGLAKYWDYTFECLV